VTGGEEAGVTFAGVASLQVTWIDSSGVAHPIVDAGLPATSIDLGSFDQGDDGMIEVTGEDADGGIVLFGSSIPTSFGALDGIIVPIFVQRVGAFARLPNPEENDARTFPVLAVVGGRYLFITGGLPMSSADSTQLYDLAGLAPLSNPPTLSAPPLSLAVVESDAGDQVADTFDDAGLTQLDLTSGYELPGTLPTGPTAADIAGGATIQAAGSQYIVGGTRTNGNPTSAVLKIDPAGNWSWLQLTQPRWGAAAVWIDAIGLVVLGGNPTASGDAGAGAESTNPTGTAFVPLTNIPPDPSVSSGAATLDDKQVVLLAGGLLPDGSDPGVRVIDLSCEAPCTPKRTWTSLPMPLGWAQAFSNRSSSGPATAVYVVGSELLTQTTRLFVLTPSAAVPPPTAAEVPTKVIHTGASAVPSPIGPPGSLLLFGGAPEIESFVPSP
jgi:hypothetical protein